MRLMLHKLSALLGVQLLELTVACGVDPEQLKHKEDDDSLEPTPNMDTTLVVTHKIQTILKGEDGLTDLTAKYELHGCAGQLEAVFMDDGIELADTALNCRIQVAQIYQGDRVYKPVDAEPEWKTGNTIRFHSSTGGGGNLDVLVDHQLSSDPKAEKQVRFVVSHANASKSAGSRTLLAQGVDQAEAPAFRIRKTDLVGMSLGGGGQFVFHLDCLKRIKTAEGSDPSCGGINLSDIHYQLIGDEYNSDLSFADAEAIFAANPGHSVDGVADFEAYKPERKQFGGFQTASGNDILQGPDKIHDHPHMLLILQAPGPSYQYFNVDVVFTSN